MTSAQNESQALGDLAAVPSRAILIGKQHKRALAILPRGAARILQEQQRQKARHVRMRQQPRQ